MEFHNSSRKALPYLALTCVMVGMSGWCATLPDLTPKIFGWLGVALFGLGFLVFPALLFRRGPMVVIDEIGIDDRRTKVGVIPWAEITQVTFFGNFLGLQFADPERYLARLSRWSRRIAKVNAALGYPIMLINFASLTPDLDEAIPFLTAILQEHGLAGDPELPD